MPYPIPSWIRPPEDPAQAYISAYRAGASVAEAQARLQVQANAQATELAVSQQRMQQQQMRQQQELEMTKAYHEATIGIRQQELAQAQQKIGMVAENAAQKLAAQTRYTQLVDSGMDPVEATLRAGPGLFPTGAGLAATAKALSEKQHPFVPEDVTTPGGVPLVHTSRGRYVLAPQKPSTETDDVFDKRGVKVPGMIRVGNRVINIPGYKDKNARELTEYWKAWGPYLVGQAQPSETEKPAFEKAKTRIQQLSGESPTSTGTNAPFAEGTKIRSKKDGKLYEVRNGEPVLVE